MYPARRKSSPRRKEPVSDNADNLAINLCATPDQADCPLDGAWLRQSPHAVQLLVTQRNATTVYATANDTILELYDLSEGTAAAFPPELLLQLLDSVLSINQTGDSTNSFFDSMLQLGSTSILGANAYTPVGSELIVHLQRLLAVPVLVFNDNFIRGANGGYPSPVTNSSIKGALATPSRRVRSSFPFTDGSFRLILRHSGSSLEVYASRGFGVWFCSYLP